MPNLPFPLPTVEQTVFLGIAAFVILAALLTVLLRNLFHASLCLTAAFFGVAGLYVLLQAEFLAVTQVLVYIGAIATLIVFAIMLSRGITNQAGRLNAQGAAVALGALFLFVFSKTILAGVEWPITTQEIPADAIARLGADFVGDYLAPFEVVSVLLLIALIGSIMIARERA